MPHKTVNLFVDSSMMGGIETHIIVLATALKQKGINVQVLFYAYHNDHPMFKALDANDIPYTVLGGSLFSLFFWACQNKDKVILHTHGYKAGIWGRLCGRLLGIPCISTYHAGEKCSGKLKLYSELDYWTSYFSENFAVSTQIASQVKHSCRILHNFVLLPQMPKPINTRKPVLRVGFVGRLSKEKSPEVFLALAKQLASEQLEFHVFGEGEACPEIKSCDKLTFHGFCDMKLYWPMLDLVIMPSTYEGLPMTALEAMAHGIPVMASDVGELDQVIDHSKNGYLLPPANQGAFSQALGDWLSLSHQQKAKLAEEARRKVEASFSGESELTLLSQVYEQYA